MAFACFGIQKICDACKELGSDLPVYELRGNGLRVHFKALPSALMDHPKVPKHKSDVLDDVLEERIIDAIQKNPRITQIRLAKLFNVSSRSLQRRMDELKAAGRIERIGGKRYGYWRIND